MAKILIAEDELRLCQQLRDWLTFERYLVDVVHNGKDALQYLRTYLYDLIILDWMIPDITGVEVCRQFRAAGGTSPILMLTGKKQLLEKEEGLDSGADDYLTKPFEPRELSARVRALLRRQASFTGMTLNTRDLVVDPRSRRVTKGDQEIHLLPLEYALLEFLMRYPGEIFSAEALLDRVWTAESEASIDAVRTYIKTLRRKITGAEQSPIIRTIYGVGYRLDPE